jgi:hypothetical protein
MAQPQGDLRFAPEERHEALVLGQMRQDALDRDQRLHADKLAAAGDEHLRHAARAQATEQLVAPEGLVRGPRQDAV